MTPVEGERRWLVEWTPATHPNYKIVPTRTEADELADRKRQDGLTVTVHLVEWVRAGPPDKMTFPFFNYWQLVSEAI